MALAQLMPSPCPEPLPWGQIVEGELCVGKEVGGIYGGVCGDVACEGQKEGAKHTPARASSNRADPPSHYGASPLVDACLVCVWDGETGSD